MHNITQGTYWLHIYCTCWQVISKKELYVSTKFCTLHQVKSAQVLLQVNYANFIMHEVWPYSSPHLKPFEYCVWVILEGKVNSKQHRCLDILKASI